MSEQAEIGNYEARQRRAYRLYVAYKTHTLEYRRIAESFGLSANELNGQMWEVHRVRRERRLARSTRATRVRS